MIVERNGKEIPELKETLRWAIFMRIIIISAILVPGVTILYGPESQFLSARLAFFYGVTLVFSTLEYLQARKADTADFLVNAHLVFDLLIISSVVDSTGSLGSQFTFLYILLILEAGVFLQRSGAVMWATISSLAYLLLGMFRTWGEGPLFSEGLVGGEPLESSVHLLLDLFFPLSLFYFVALAIGYISTRLNIASRKVSDLGREFTRLSLESSDILYHIPTGVMTCDMSGRLIYLNPAGLEILRLDEDGFIGYPVEVALREHHDELRKMIEWTIRERSPIVRGEAILGRTQEGEPVHLGISTSLLHDLSGEGIGVTAIFQDISHLKRLETLSQRALRLEAFTELSASMAHEIRTPLTTIRSSLELLEGSTRDDERKKLIAVVRKESVRLSQLLEDFLGFARVRIREWKPVDLLELVREVEVLLRVRPEFASRIVVRCDGFRGEGKDIVWGDPELLKQVFLNLFTNASEAIMGQGHVRVRMEQVGAQSRPGKDGGEGFQTVLIEDDGPGFSEEASAKAFDPFFTTKRAGSGLGLSISQRIIEAHGGTIELVSSRRDTGGCIAIRLPYQKPAEMIEAKIEATPLVSSRSSR